MKNVVLIFLFLIVNITPAQVSTPHTYTIPKVCEVVEEKISHHEILKFLINQEGFHKICIDDGSQFTNGYGTRAKFEGEVINKKEAYKRLEKYYYKKLKYTKKTYPNLTETEARVVTAVFYNLGSASNKPDLHKALKIKHLPQIKQQLLTCIGKNPKYKKGLTNRRKREIKLLEKVWNFS